MKAAIISPDQQLSDRLQREVSKDAAVRFSRLAHYADALELGRFIRNETPVVIFLDAESSTCALAAVEAIVAGFPAIQVVAIFNNPASNTCSGNPQDVEHVYKHQAAGYITKHAGGRFRAKPGCPERR